MIKFSTRSFPIHFFEAGNHQQPYHPLTFPADPLEIRSQSADHQIPCLPEDFEFTYMLCLTFQFYVRILGHGPFPQQLDPAKQLEFGPSPELFVCKRKREASPSPPKNIKQNYIKFDFIWTAQMGTFLLSMWATRFHGSCLSLILDPKEVHGCPCCSTPSLLI